MKCGCDRHIEYCEICYPLKDRKASVDFRSRGEVLITSDGETHVFHCELPARKPLTDNELWEMWVESPSDVLRFARAIERAHGIGEQ